MGNEANGAEKDKGGEEQAVAEQRQRIGSSEKEIRVDGGSPRVKARLWQYTNRRINHPATH